MTFGRTLLNLLLPLRCVKCGTPLDDQPGLCPPCWAEIPFISSPFCAICGVPFDFEIEEGALCTVCATTRPFYTSSRSLFSYTPTSKDLILKFKHLDGVNLAKTFAQWMSRLSQVEEALCIPVPLHWTRLFMRTYNQAALLAQELARLKGWEYAPTLLLRKKMTVSQGHLSRKDRIKNVRKAFIIKESKKAILANKTIILVDDVFTTGATLEACTKPLLKAGAKEVHALTLGRVFRKEHSP